MIHSWDLNLETKVILWYGVRHLSDEDAMVIKLGLDDVLVEWLGVQLIAGASFHWICQVSNYHVKPLPALLQLNSAPTIRMGYVSKHV